MKTILTRQNRTDLAKMFGELGYKRGAEIGVRRGNFSAELCFNIPTLEKLYSIDPWTSMDGDSASQKVGQDKQDRIFRQAVRRLRRYPTCQIIRKTSMEAVRDIPYSSLDFVYIDGSHMFDYVMTDIIKWTKRVKKGGIVSGDDYHYLRFQDVVRAVNNYAEAHDIKILNVMEPPEGDEYPVPTWWFSIE